MNEEQEQSETFSVLCCIWYG